VVKPKNILASIHRTGRQWVSINCENEVQCVRLLICILSIRSYESTSFVWIYTLLFIVLCGGRLRLVWFCRLWCQDDFQDLACDRYLLFARTQPDTSIFVCIFVKLWCDIISSIRPNFVVFTYVFRIVFGFAKHLHKHH
jgi:hypothetical protein